jgi:hypothetical protein
MDHVPPWSARSILIEYGVTKWDFVEVEACRQCNSALGNKTLWTLTERKAYMKDWIRRRYKRVLNQPEWSEDEKAELGHSLCEYVTAYQILAEITRRRLKW